MGYSPTAWRCVPDVSCHTATCLVLSRLCAPSAHCRSVPIQVQNRACALVPSSRRTRVGNCRSHKHTQVTSHRATVYTTHLHREPAPAASVSLKGIPKAPRMQHAACTAPSRGPTVGRVLDLQSICPRSSRPQCPLPSPPPRSRATP